MRPKPYVGMTGVISAQEVENVEQRVHVLKERLGRADFCIDAEGALRDKHSLKYGDDTLNLRKTRLYARGATRAFQSDVML